MAEKEKDHLVRNVGIGAGIVTVLVVAVIVAPELMRDKWELRNAGRVSAKVEEANRLQTSDPLGAYKILDEVLKEAQQHKITDEGLSKSLASAENSRTALYPKVHDKILAEEAEKQRRAEEEARHAAVEKERIAKEEERKHAVEEADRIAVEKRRVQEKRRGDAVTIYRNAPPSARNALNAFKKVEARTEVGINYRDYSAVVGEAWGDVKIFIESPEGKRLPEYSVLLTKAASDYKLALDVWQNKIQWPTLYGDRADVEALQQACWSRAGKRIELAESLLDAEKTAKALETFAVLPAHEEDLDAAWKKIGDKVLHRGQASATNGNPNSGQFGSWGADFESGTVKRIGDVDVVLAYKFSTVYVPQNASNTVEATMSDFGKFFSLGYRKTGGAFADPTAGFIPVNGQPQKIEYSSSNKSVVEIYQDGSAGFRGGGKAEITARVAGQPISVGVTVIDLPVKTGGNATGAQEVIQRLGLPDDKTKHYISWPKSQEIEGVFYSPSVGGGIATEHWKYKKYPGAVIAIVGGAVWCVGTHKD